MCCRIYLEVRVNARIESVGRLLEAMAHCPAFQPPHHFVDPVAIAHQMLTGHGDATPVSEKGSAITVTAVHSVTMLRSPKSYTGATGASPGARRGSKPHLTTPA